MRLEEIDLLDHPSEYARLRADPALLASAIEVQRVEAGERIGPVARLPSVFINGPRRMPVRITERRA